jgi:hypothetical protein
VFAFALANPKKYIKTNIANKLPGNAIIINWNFSALLNFEWVM